MPVLDSPEEYNRYYAKTYIGFISTNKIIPYNVQVVIPNKDISRIVFQGYIHEENTWIPKTAKYEELTFDYPQCGVINHKELVIWVKRDTGRQYLRGFPEQYERL